MEATIGKVSMAFMVIGDLGVMLSLFGMRSAGNALLLIGLAGFGLFIWRDVIAGAMSQGQQAQSKLF